MGRRREEGAVRRMPYPQPSSQITEFSCRSTRKKDFAERFFAKRSGERFKRGVRLCRITRRVRSAVTTSVRGKKCEPAINHVREEGSHASRPCVQARFLPTMAKNSFRGARTPHCGDVHNTPLNLPLRYSICAYLRSSRQGAFCGHSAIPNATLFTPVAPLHENLFCKNIFVIAAVHFSKSEPPRAILLPSARYRGKPRTEHSDCGVFLNLTTFSYRSTRKKDFTERFFAKRSGERFKRGVRRSRTARRVRSAATTSVRKKKS